MTHKHPMAPGTTISRPEALDLLRTARAVKEIRFARNLSLHWLGEYPGDLSVQLELARITHRVRGAKKAQVQTAELVLADPAWPEAQTTHYQFAREAAIPAEDTAACLLALGEPTPKDLTLPEWGIFLRKARQSLDTGRMDEAELFTQRALLADPPSPLAAVMHLEVVHRNQQATPRAVITLAEHYLERWPTCVPCLLFQADSLMANGDSEHAVAILHKVVGMDVSGQVARRMWGADHPYRTLWPEELWASFEFPIPAALAAARGWNILPPIRSTRTEEIPSGWGALGENVSSKSPSMREINLSTEPQDHGPKPESRPKAREDKPDRHPAGGQSPSEGREQRQDQNLGLDDAPSTGEPDESSTNPVEALQAELKRLSKRVKKPQIEQQDGRYPVYVIFSTRQGLERKYSVQAAQWVIDAMRSLARAVRERADWDAVVLLADDTTSTATRGIKPASAKDPWALKLLLKDLDQALRARGEMIGAVLIVGGPEVVPFHHLPNPIDDEDEDVPSDNPYATRDENFFVSEWPVGRLPGGSGSDPAHLLEVLYKITARHNAKRNPLPWYRRWFRRYIQPFLAILWPGDRLARESFGYTAAAWRKASLSVFRPIGESRSMLASPPTLADHLPWNGLNPARLAYYNLHGLAEVSDWFGQRDPGDPYEGPDYPVALRPSDIMNSGRAPEIVYSEACFGGHIIGKRVEEAMALKFLNAGTQAVVGSTATAYGSIASPLIAADLLGHAFWSALRAGQTAGEALKSAKLHLAQEMNRRQGYLDGEDQKTLISFVLYGDPLATPGQSALRTAKSRPIRTEQAAKIKTICDRAREEDRLMGAPEQVVDQVKRVVEQYLPGMMDAELVYSHEHDQCTGDDHTCPTSQVHAKKSVEEGGNRQVVTLSKKVERDQHNHPLYARITLDGQGKVVKLAVSR